MPGLPMTLEWGKAAWLWRREVEQLTGIKTIFYTNKSNYWILWALGLKWLEKEPLAYAQYPFRTWNKRILQARTDTDIWNPSLPKPHKADWLFWQASADENAAVDMGAQHGVESDAVDWDLFNGTKKDLQIWAGVSDEEIVVDENGLPGGVDGTDLDESPARAYSFGKIDAYEDVIQYAKKKAEEG